MLRLNEKERNVKEHLTLPFSIFSIIYETSGKRYEKVVLSAGLCY